jgi:hypothetical protein
LAVTGSISTFTFPGVIQFGWGNRDFSKVVRAAYSAAHVAIAPQGRQVPESEESRYSRAENACVIPLYDNNH